MKCDNCPSELNYRLYSVGKGVWVCERCYRRPQSMENVNLHKKVKLDSMWVTQAQINEMDRMRILPYEHPEKATHYVGRMGENGKIQERIPDFRS